MDNSSPVTATYIRTVYKRKFKSLFLIARGLFKPTSSSSGSTLPSGFPRCHRYWHRGLFKAPKPDKEIGRRPAPVCIIRPGRADPRRRHAQHTPRGRAGRVPSSRQPGRRLSMDLCHFKKKKTVILFRYFFFLKFKTVLYVRCWRAPYPRTDCGRGARGPRARQSNLFRGSVTSTLLPSLRPINPVDNEQKSSERCATNWSNMPPSQGYQFHVVQKF